MILFIHLAENPRQTTPTSTVSEDNTWKTITCRKRKPAKVIVGNNNVNSGIAGAVKGVPKFVDLHVYRVAPDTTKDSMESLLKPNIPEFLIGKNLERLDPSREDIERMYNENEIRPYYVDGPESAQVNMQSAIPLLCQYCSSLPSDMYTLHAPEWYLKSNCESGEPDEKRFSIVIILPTICPILEAIEGPFMKTVKVAKRAAALRACEALHKVGELDDNLLPRRRMAKEEDIKFLFPHYPIEREKGAGSAKMRRLHKTHISHYNKGQIKEHSICFLSVIQLDPLFKKSEDKNDGALYDIYTSSLCYGIITPSRLPVICDFPIYTTMGTINISLRVNQKIHSFNKEEIFAMREFQVEVFADILKILKPFVIFDNTENVGTMLVVPVKKSNLEIYFEIMRQHNCKKVSEIVELATEEKLNLEVSQGNFLGRIVTPWYRRTTHYLVTEVSFDKSALSPFPNENYSSFKDYFEKQHDLEISNPSLPLLFVRGLTKRMNFIKPRERQSKRKRDDMYEEMGEYLLPELVVKHDFPAALWVQASFLPTIISRILTMLHAEELRCKICGEADIEEKSSIVRKKLQLDEYLLDYKAFVEEEHPDITIASVDDITIVPQTNTHLNKDYSKKKLEKQYPWKDDEEPKDINRDLAVTIEEVEHFEMFVGEQVRNKGKNKDIPLKDNERLELTHSENFVHRSIQFLEKPCNSSEPELCELYKALTTAKANDIVNLERLETLGDSFLKIISSVYIAMRFSKYDEGQATDLKGRLVSNKNLYYLAVRKNLNGMIRYNELSPKENWLPPGFSIPKEIEKKINVCEMSMKVLESLRFDYEEQVSGEISKDSLNRILNLDYPPNDSEEDFYQRLSPFLKSQYIGDKYVADVVEALLGGYLGCSGFQGGIKFIEWMGIIPPSENIETLLRQPPPNPVLNENNIKNVDYYIPHWEEIERILNYNFKNRAFLLQALTHASYTPNRVTRSYEQLEFLGDAVLDFLVTCYVYESCGNLNPGQLTDLRSALVNNNTFASLVVRNGLHKFLLMINSKLQGLIDRFVALMVKKDYEVDDEVLILLEDEEFRLAEAVDVPKVLGDIFEALAGAIFLDSGKDLKTVWNVFYKLMFREITKFSKNVPMNIIRRLYEWNGANPKFGAAYHYSCAERIGNVKLQSELGGILTFTCCQPKTEGEYSENVKILRLTLENNILRQLLEEVRDKNLILKENNSLLIQRFTSLEKTLSSEKTLTKNGQTEAQNVNNARQIDNDKRASVSVIPTENYLVFSETLSDTNPKKTHDPTPISTISSEIASGTTSYSMVLKNNPNAISSNATEIGNNVPNNKQENGNRRDLTKNSPAPESDDKQTWQNGKAPKY
ncbi:hypothetical protein JTB14_002616 [Gonioctena quinquepunctata]|nr:hypothetical protein JTB14_002616 [Gonioctena quinquepunctata]